ncbi:MAG: DUF881 domain-containing protein [Chloroflexota bacterium]
MRTGIRKIPNQVALTAVAVVLGFLVVVQIRSQSASPGLAGLSAQELTVVVANLSEQNDRLRVEVQGLERQSGDLASDRDRGDVSLSDLRLDLARIRAWAGLAPVSGQGVRVEISGPLPAEGVADILNELRNAGAEAVAVNGVRVVPGVVVSGAAGQLAIGGQALVGPVVIEAIGQSETLTGSLSRAGGPVAQLGARFPDATVEVTPADHLLLGATNRTLVPAHGRPRI